MRTRPLGRTATRIPEVGLGTYRFRESADVLRGGLDAGATFIDTAELYGNEALVGEAINGRRDEVFVATKLRNLRAADVVRSADESLAKLRCEWIDLYQVHFPDAAVPIAETMGALERLVDAGKVRHVGVSNFSVPELRAAQAAYRYAIVSNQVPYSLIERSIEVDVLSYCAANGITVIAYSPLAQGLDHIERRDPSGALRDVARRVGRTAAQVALNWCLRHPHVVVIPKGRSVAHVVENCAASGWSLDEASIARLDRAIGHARRSRLHTGARRFVRQWRQRLGLAR